MAKENLTLKDIDKLLSQQTKETNKLLSQQTAVILSAVDKRLENFEKKISIKVDKLRNTIDKFVVLYTKQEQEFTIMKEHLKRLEIRMVKLEKSFA